MPWGDTETTYLTVDGVILGYSHAWSDPEYGGSGVSYNDAEWNKTKSMDGNIGECTPGTCLESFTDTQNNLKPFNYFNNYSLF